MTEREHILGPAQRSVWALRSARRLAIQSSSTDIVDASVQFSRNAAKLIIDVIDTQQPSQDAADSLQQEIMTFADQHGLADVKPMRLDRDVLQSLETSVDRESVHSYISSLLQERDVFQGGLESFLFKLNHTRRKAGIKKLTIDELKNCNLIAISPMSSGLLLVSVLQEMIQRSSDETHSDIFEIVTSAIDDQDDGSHIVSTVSQQNERCCTFIDDTINFSDTRRRTMSTFEDRYNAVKVLDE